MKAPMAYALMLCMNEGRQNGRRSNAAGMEEGAQFVSSLHRDFDRLIGRAFEKSSLPPVGFCPNEFSKTDE